MTHVGWWKRPAVARGSRTHRHACIHLTDRNYVQLDPRPQLLFFLSCAKEIVISARAGVESRIGVPEQDSTAR
jgi:hypothetical protein